MGSVEKKIATIMRERGYKLTPQRLAVLNVVVDSEDHLTPAAIYDKVRHKHGAVGLVTIYRTLNMLDDLGLICRVHGHGDNRSYLIRRPLEHHHHLVCSECGKVVDFTGCNLCELERRLSEETGFEIDSHILEFAGHCRNCRNKAVKQDVQMLHAVPE